MAWDDACWIALLVIFTLHIWTLVWIVFVHASYILCTISLCLSLPCTAICCHLSVLNLFAIWCMLACLVACIKFTLSTIRFCLYMTMLHLLLHAMSAIPVSCISVCNCCMLACWCTRTAYTRTALFLYQTSTVLILERPILKKPIPKCLYQTRPTWKSLYQGVQLIPNRPTYTKPGRFLY